MCECHWASHPSHFSHANGECHFSHAVLVHLNLTSKSKWSQRLSSRAPRGQLKKNTHTHSFRNADANVYPAWWRDFVHCLILMNKRSCKQPCILCDSWENALMNSGERSQRWLAGSPASPGCLTEDQRKCVLSSLTFSTSVNMGFFEDFHIWKPITWDSVPSLVLLQGLKCLLLFTFPKKHTPTWIISAAACIKPELPKVCYLYDFLELVFLKPSWNHKWRRLTTSLITEMSWGCGVRCIRETQLRGITCVWNPVNLFI